MMKANHPLQAGFSLIEMITATAIVTIFIFGISTILVSFSVQQDKLQTGISADLDHQLSDRILARDFLNAAPSLNNLLVADDNGLNFFDYYPDITPTSFAGETRRVLTLGGTQNADIYLILTDARLGAPMLYDPTAAYAFGAPPANMNTPGTSQFISLNRNGYIESLNPQLWQEGRILMLDTPARVRSSATARERPRSPFFIGRIQGTALTPILLGALDRRDPLNPAILIDSEDRFFRRAPAMSGGSPIVRLKAVQIVRYSARPSVRRPGLVDIYRQVLDGSGLSEGQLFAKDVRSLQLIRNSIFHPVLSYHLIDANAPGGGR